MSEKQWFQKQQAIRGRSKSLRETTLVDSQEPSRDSESASDNMGSLTTEDWMTTDQAAQYLNVSSGSLRNMTAKGLIRYYKLGRRNRYLLTDLKKLLLSNQRGGSNGNF